MKKLSTFEKEITNKMDASNAADAKRLLAKANQLLVFFSNDNGEDGWVIAPDSEPGFWFGQWYTLDKTLEIAKAITSEEGKGTVLTFSLKST